MYLPLADATVLTFLAPGLACFLCSVFINEPFTRLEQIGTLFSLAGVVLIARPTSMFATAPSPSPSPPSLPLRTNSSDAAGHAGGGGYGGGSGVGAAQRAAAVGVAKPNRAFFEGALTRLGLPPTLATCLFISEDADHVARAAALGMHTLRFGGHTSPADATADFTDWAVAPAMVAARLAPGPTPAMTAAVRVFLETTLGLSVSAVTPPAGDGDPFRADARTPSPLSDPALGELAGVHVSLPVRPAVWVSPAGRVTRVEGTDPSAADLAEATLYVQSLASNGQVEAVAGESPLGPTHAVETDAQGLRTLTRKRFTAY